MKPPYTKSTYARRGHVLLVLGLLAGVCCSFTATAHASLLAVGWSAEESPVYRLEVPDGPVTLLGYSGFRGLNSLARGPEDIYYSVATYTDRSVLVSIDPLTGLASELAPLDAIGVRGLACSVNGELYGALASGKIVQINPQNGITTPILQTPYILMQGLAFSPNGFLYAWDGDAGLIKIDTVAKTTDDVNPDIGGLLSIQTIYFTPDGFLHGARNYLYDIDLNTGSPTQRYLVGPLDIRGAEVLAPEPASLLLLAGAVGALATRRNRRASNGPMSRH